MKKIYLLLAFTCILNHVSAQQKSEFGLVIKAGTFTLASEKSGVAYSEYSEYTTTETRRPGISYYFGAYQSLRLGKHFSVSAELLYRYSDYSFSHTYQYRYQEPDIFFNSDTQQGYQVSENSISLPIKIHFAFRENGRTSFGFGAGVSRIISTERIEATRKEYNVGYQNNNCQSTSPPIRSNFKGSDNLLTLTAGFYHRLGANTRLGVEFSYEKNRDILAVYTFDSSKLGSCINYDPSFELPRLKSFTISLFHNILR